MARPQSITTERLLEVAREVFTEYGFSATTLQIARRAGISEGTLFKRFATKEQLFEEAIGLGDVPRWWGRLGSMVGQGDVQHNLEGVCLKTLEIARQVLPRLMMMWSRGLHPPPHLHSSEDPFERGMHALTEYLKAEAKLGRIRAADHEVLSRTVLGTLISRVIGELHRPSGSGEPDDAHFVRGLTDLLWRGLRPPEER